jgi:hypothetical protein
MGRKKGKSSKSVAVGVLENENMSSEKKDLMRNVSSKSDIAATDYEARRIPWYEGMWLLIFGKKTNKSSEFHCLVNHMIVRVCVRVF